MTGHDPDQVPPFGHPRINAWLPTPRGLSQAPTSFFGSWCQGIHPVLLPTSPTRQHHPPHHHHDTRPGSRTRDRSTMSTSPAKTKDARVHCAVLNQQPGTHPSAPTRHHPPPPTKVIGTSRSEDQAEPTKANTPPPPTTGEPPLRGSALHAPPPHDRGTAPPERHREPVPSGPNSVHDHPAHPHPDDPHPPRTTPPTPRREQTRRHQASSTSRGPKDPQHSLSVSVPPSSTRPAHTTRTPRATTPRTRWTRRPDAADGTPTTPPPPDRHRPRRTSPAPRRENATGSKLLRKEVIQPHLPVRLPCYDFVPIASPTFDGSPHKGWATGFGCYRLS